MSYKVNFGDAIHGVHFNHLYVLHYSYGLDISYQITNFIGFRSQLLYIQKIHYGTLT